MPLASLESIFRKILSSRHIGAGLQVSWHSGEPLVLKPAYYKAAMDAILGLKRTYCPAEFAVHFDIQTNGTLINQAWCDLLKEYEGTLSMGISCDGPAFLHDAHRKDWAGRPTHKQTLAGMELLRSNSIRYDVIAVVSHDSLDHPEEFIEFFAPFTDDIREFHFNLHDELNIRLEDRGALERYTKRYDQFLRRLLNVYSNAEGSPVPPKIRNFSSFYELMFSEAETKPQYDARSMSRPLRTLNVQANGDVSTFYAGLTGAECPDLYGDGQGLIVGNLLTQDLDDVASSAKLGRIAQDFERSHSACEAGCDYYGLCSGGYNLIKYKRFGRFDVTETPECAVHVKTFAGAVLDELNRGTSR